MRQERQEVRQRRTTQERKTERHQRKIAESWQTIRTQQQQSVRGFKGLPFLLQLSVDLFVGFPFDFLIQPLFVRLPSQTAHVWGRAKDRNLSCRRPTGEVWISRPSASESECARPPVRPSVRVAVAVRSFRHKASASLQSFRIQEPLEKLGKTHLRRLRAPSPWGLSVSFARDTLCCCLTTARRHPHLHHPEHSLVHRRHLHFLHMRPIRRRAASGTSSHAGGRFTVI